MLAVLVILGGSLSAFSYSVNSVRAWGTIVGLSSNQWVELQTVKTGENAFAYYGTSEGSSMTNVNYMSYYFLTDSTSISNFSIIIHEFNAALSNLTNWGVYSIYIYKYNNGSLSGGTSVSDKTSYSPVEQADGSWVITWDYIGDAVEGSVIRLSFRNSPYVLSATEWKNFTVERFNVNGNSYVFTDGEQAIINNLDSINSTLQDDSTYYQSSSEIPSPDTSHIGDGGSFASSSLNEKLGLFDISGAVQRTLVPLGTYLFTPNSFDDSSSGHTAIVAISTISMCVVVIVWIINSLHRSRGWIE